MENPLWMEVLIGKSPLNDYKWFIFHCHVWLPSGDVCCCTVAMTLHLSARCEPCSVAPGDRGAGAFAVEVPWVSHGILQENDRCGIRGMTIPGTIPGMSIFGWNELTTGPWAGYVWGNFEWFICIYIYISIYLYIYISLCTRANDNGNKWSLMSLEVHLSGRHLWKEKR